VSNSMNFIAQKLSFCGVNKGIFFVTRGCEWAFINHRKMPTLIIIFFLEERWGIFCVHRTDSVCWILLFYIIEKQLRRQRMDRRHKLSLSLTTFYYRKKMPFSAHVLRFSFSSTSSHHVHVVCAPPNKMRKTIPDDIYCFLFSSLIQLTLTPPTTKTTIAVALCVIRTNS
jgi:hypothetical protein